MAPPFSLVTTCVKRWDYLAHSLPSWRALPRRGNLFVVTYDFDTLPSAGVPGAHVVVVKNGGGFHRTRALNLGALVARQLDRAPFLLFTDADIVIQSPLRFAGPLAGSTSVERLPDFVLDSPYALTSKRRGLRAEEDPELRTRGVRGTHWVRSELFFRVGGFNQHLRGWGFDDFELYLRYELQSGRLAFYDRGTLFHQPHGDDERVALQAETPQQSMRRNKQLALERSDPLGQSWASELGYPEFEVIAPR